jgi:hypothetical protein
MLGNQRCLPFLDFTLGNVLHVVVFSLCILIFKHMDEGLSVSRRQFLARLRVLVKHILVVRLDFSVIAFRLFCLNWPAPVHLTLILNTHLAPLDCNRLRLSCFFLDGCNSARLSMTHAVK